MAGRYPTLRNKLVMTAVRHPVPRIGGRMLVGLRVTGARTGRRFELPVQHAHAGAGLVVVPGHAEQKRWWRNLRTRPEVEVLHEGTWRPMTATVLLPGDPSYDRARAAYEARWRHARLPADQPVVLLT
ncbi:MAG: nitroreductase/quinone reductase family protein [Nocardioides sp.]